MAEASVTGSNNCSTVLSRIRASSSRVSIRIGSAFPEPANRRMMSTWLSFRDLTNLVAKALVAPKVGHTVVYGVSANRDVWWDTRASAALGFVAQDSSEVFRAKVEALPPVAPDDPAAVYQGVAEPLTADDVADAVAWSVTRPEHFNVDLMVIRPRAQAAQYKVFRES